MKDRFRKEDIKDRGIRWDERFGIPLTHSCRKHQIENGWKIWSALLSHTKASKESMETG